MQWPRDVEEHLREDHARIVAALQEHETVRLLVEDAAAQAEAEEALSLAGADPAEVSFQEADYDWSWMRDNGPVWVETEDGPLAVDWRFDGWGGAGGDVSDDDAIPCLVADLAGAPCETRSLVLERGNLEVDGAGGAILNWTCQHARNPGVTKQRMEAELAEALGIERVVWIEGSPTGDLTLGHLDGIARFVDDGTVAVARYADADDPDAGLYEDAADAIAAAGYEVVRVEVPGEVTYHEEPMAANYLNWLVGGDIVVATGFGHAVWDAAAVERIEELFPGMQASVVRALDLWYDGGGVHCVTNDQPEIALAGE